MKKHLTAILVWIFALPFTAFAAQVQSPQQDESYILRPNDVVRLAVYEEADLSVQVRILKTGQVSFPLIGSVDVAGLKISEAARKIRDLYAKDYLVEPQLTLTVDEYATDFISVIGAVIVPGQIAIPVSGHIDLGSAIATAGGLSENADPHRISLVRSSGETSVYSLEAIQGSVGRVRMQSGDRIIVPQSSYVGKSVTILGRVVKPGSVPFPLNGKLDIVTAISLAGGISDLGNAKKVSINRKGHVRVVNFRDISESGESPLPLQPDDIITVAERLF